MKFEFAAAAAALCIVSTSGFAAETRSIIADAMTELMVEKKLDAIDTYFAEPYIQHNQSVPTGIAGLKGLAAAAIAENSAFKYELIRIFADGDVGVVHGVYEGFGETPLVAFDVFRVEGDKIVEHWDNLAPVAPPNPSGRSQVDGPTEVVDLERTEDNKALVAEFIEVVLINGEFDKMGAFFDGDNYVQHNANIGDGLSGLATGLKALADAGIDMRILRTHELYGEGNFVLALSEGTIGDRPTAFYDLFRIDDGKISEHWDVISEIIPDDAAANGNGKF